MLCRMVFLEANAAAFKTSMQPPTSPKKLLPFRNSGALLGCFLLAAGVALWHYGTLRKCRVARGNKGGLENALTLSACAVTCGHLHAVEKRCREKEET